MPTSEKLKSGFLITLNGLSAPLMILNTFGGIISCVWLAILGQWGVIFGGIFLILISGFGIKFALMPGLLFVAPAMIALEKGKKLLGISWVPWGMLYTYTLITTWCLWVMFHYMIINPAHKVSLIPMLIWSYGIAVAPWVFLAQNDQQGGGNEYSIFTAFTAQIAYVVAMIMFSFASLHSITVTFVLIMLLGALLQMSLAFSGENKKIIRKKRG